MSYIYRPPNTKNITQVPPDAKKVEVPTSKQLSKQQLKSYESVFLIIGYLLKSNSMKKLKESFLKMKSLTAKKKKYSQALAKKVNLLFQRKQKQSTNIFFSNLVANRIQFYNNQMKTQKQLKQVYRQRAAGILFCSFSKIYSKKFKSSFQEIKKKGLQYAKSRNFKITHLFARLSLIYKHQLEIVFNKLAQNKIKIMTKAKVLNKLQIFFDLKNKRNIATTFNSLKINDYYIRINAAQSTVSEQIKPQSKEPSKAIKTVQTAINKAQVQRKQLQQRQKKLQSQITRVQQSSARVFTPLRGQISRLEKENQELKFNNDLVGQNNFQLQKQIQVKQIKIRRKLPKNQIWENVYNNYIYFLAINKDKNITKEQFLESLQLPLVPFTTNLDEIKEENQILAELLEEYKKSFPEPENKDSQGQIEFPLDFLKKKNRYYYMVLQVLSEWGVSGSKELESLNSDLQKLQKKLLE